MPSCLELLDRYQYIAAALIVVTGYCLIHFIPKRTEKRYKNRVSRRHGILDGVGIIVAEHVGEYRQCIKEYVNATDNILFAKVNASDTV